MAQRASVEHSSDHEAADGVIPVYRPLLPDAERLTPYLRRIDAARVYSNWGPLVTELEVRIALQMGLADGAVVSAASGTSALVGAVLATAGAATADRPIALLPSFSFVATALAAEQCGYRPSFVDVDAVSWRLDPDELEHHPMLANVGVVIPVAPFGRGIEQTPWEKFQQRTGIPVVIDGGASFETICASSGKYIGGVPVTLSFHATKSFSTGEGGCVITTDGPSRLAVFRALNFGFFGSRECGSASTNGKMSEYHAAVGLAELDGWSQKHAGFENVVRAYREQLDAAHVPGNFVSAPSVASCYALLHCNGADVAERVRDSLNRSRIEHRAWYGGGIHRQLLYASTASRRLAVTEDLGRTVIGLPMACDLPTQSVTRVVSAVAGGLR